MESRRTDSMEKPARSIRSIAEDKNKQKPAGEPKYCGACGLPTCQCGYKQRETEGKKDK